MATTKVTIDQLLHWQKQIEGEQVEAAKKRFPELSSTESGAYRAGICAGIREIVSTLTLHGHLEVR